MHILLTTLRIFSRYMLGEFSLPVCLTMQLYCKEKLALFSYEYLFPFLWEGGGVGFGLNFGHFNFKTGKVFETPLNSKVITK